MRKIIIILSIFALIVSGCNNSKKRQNSLYGKIYRDLSDIPELSDYKTQRGDMLTSDDDEKELCFEHYRNENNHNIGILAEIIGRETLHENWKIAKYKLLDTINIGKIAENEFLSVRRYDKDTITEEQTIIISIVSEDKEFNRTIHKAWYVNLKTEKFEKNEIKR